MSMETSTKLPTLIIKLIAVVGKLVQWNWNVEQGKQGFIFSILWCSYTSYQPLEDLAKFGYGSKRKVKTCIIFLWHLLELIVQIWKFKKKIQNLLTSLGAIFFTKILCMSCSWFHQKHEPWKEALNNTT
jgi:amino acid permease